MAVHKFLSALLVGASFVGFSSLSLAQPAPSQASVPHPTTAQTTVGSDSSSLFNSKDSSLKWALRMDDMNFTSALNTHENMFDFRYSLIYDLKINSYLALNFWPEIIAQNGYIQAPDVENPQTSRIDIMNASLDLSPAYFVKLSAGSLSENRDQWHPYIMFRDLSFPAVRLVLQTEPTQFIHTFAYGEVAIPTASSINNNSNDFNKVPTLNTAGIGLDIGRNRDSMTGKLRLGFYQYNDIPQSISTASANLGNSATATLGTDYVLKYQFAGYDGSASTLIKWGKFFLSGFVEGIKNSNAPSAKSLGFVGQVKPGYNFNPFFSLAPFYRYFSIQSDATLAAYNEDLYCTNYNGYYSGFEMGFSEKYYLRVAYIERAPLVVNAFQPEDQGFEVRFYTKELNFF